MTYVSTFEPAVQGGVQEDRFKYANSISIGDGVEILYKYAVYITQIVASWTTSSDITLKVTLPSGTTYSIDSYTSSTSFTLNTRAENYIYWAQLPAGSRVRFDVSTSAISDLSISVISNPL